MYRVKKHLIVTILYSVLINKILITKFITATILQNQNSKMINLVGTCFQK